MSSRSNKMVELGPGRSPPVTIVPMPEEERAEMGECCPISPANGPQASRRRAFQRALFSANTWNALRYAGEVPARDWDK
jgi:hypothetical protein